jgi:hypothetical protein
MPIRSAMAGSLAWLLYPTMSAILFSSTST